MTFRIRQLHHSGFPFSLLVLFLPFFAAAGPARAQQPSSTAVERPFVRVDGTQFFEGDRPFFFVGANLNVMHEPVARAKAEETIAAAAGDGLRVARIWALGEGRPDGPSWQGEYFLFRLGPEGWQPNAYRQLDRVVAAAGRYGLRLIVTLSNRWGDYGGIPMYLRWAGQYDATSYGYTDRFFTDERVRGWFLEHVRRIVTRVNSITGVRYSDDPTIMAWELQNEMNGTPEAAAARRAWTAEISRAIRAMDPHHLIVPGVLGYDLELEREEWIAMCELPEVSYCDQHVYPENGLRSRGVANLRAYIDDRVQLAHYVVGKPIVFGEFGFAHSHEKVSERARWHNRFLRRLFMDGGNGAMVWIYQPTLPWERTFPVLIDDRRYQPVRRVLERWARRAETLDGRCHNPRLGPQRGRRPIAPTHALVRGPDGAHRRWVGDATKGQGASWSLSIPVTGYEKAWFEEAGVWDGGVLVHAYGRRTGWFEYRFAAPPVVPRRLQLRVRLSSEYPGLSAPATGVSLVTVLIDGRFVGQVLAPPDDGVGRWVELTVDDSEVLRRLVSGPHTLRFEVRPGDEANGVALYGVEAPLNREPVDDPGPMELVAFTRSSQSAATRRTAAVASARSCSR